MASEGSTCLGGVCFPGAALKSPQLPGRRRRNGERKEEKMEEERKRKEERRKKKEKKEINK